MKQKKKIVDPSVEATRTHDIEVFDLTEYDIDMIRSGAAQRFVDQRSKTNVELIVESYNAFLHSKGYKITKVGDK